MATQLWTLIKPIAIVRSATSFGEKAAPAWSGEQWSDAQRPRLGRRRERSLEHEALRVDGTRLILPKALCSASTRSAPSTSLARAAAGNKATVRARATELNFMANLPVGACALCHDAVAAFFHEIWPI
jgi:hypothetical protein